MLYDYGSFEFGFIFFRVVDRWNSLLLAAGLLTLFSFYGDNSVNFFFNEYKICPY